MTNQDNPFVVPRPHSAPPEGQSFDAKATRAWLAALPTGDPLATAREMIRYLVAMNLIALPPGERIQSLESLRPSLEAVSGQLAEKAFGSTLPLSKRQREQLDLSTTTRVLMVQGYKLGLQSLGRGAWVQRLLDRQARGLAAHRTLTLLGEIILTSYRRYRPPLPHAWRELHGIYGYARRHRIHDRRIRDTTDGGGSRRSCTDVYKRLLLLAVSDPYGLPRDELDYLLSALPAWAGACHLRQIRENQDPGTSILIDPTSDAPPWQPVDHRDAPRAAGWQLDISPLPKLLSQLCVALEDRARRRAATAEETVQKQLLTRLMHDWSDRPVRSAGPHQGRCEVEVVRGVGPAVQALYLALESKTDADASRESHDVGPLSGELRRMGWQAGGQPVIQRYDYSDPKNPDHGHGFKTESLAAGRAVQRLEGCALRDESASGCRLVHAGQNGRCVSVGDLIGIRFKNGEEIVERWRFGTVRWLRAGQAAGTEFGIRFIEGTSEPVSLKPASRNKTGAYPLPALLLFDGRHPPSLITTPFGMTDRAEFSLKWDDAEHRIVFRDEIESTGSFSRFTFEILDPA